jgi:hypothetical protein
VSMLTTRCVGKKKRRKDGFKSKAFSKGWTFRPPLLFFYFKC